MINPRLLAISGFRKEAVRVVKNQPLILGRDPSNQVEVSDPAVSRRHCSLSEVSAGVFEITDLDSRHGTFVNQTQVSRKTLEHGDRIRIGSSEFVFLTSPEDDAALLTSRPGSQAATAELKTMSLIPPACPPTTSG